MNTITISKNGKIVTSIDVTGMTTEQKRKLLLQLNNQHDPKNYEVNLVK